ncbi:hypothetical protein QRK73_002753, partial [Enterococcus faecalis]|nr:hypothetical protein [Enterococcus faecalis]
MSHIPFEIQQQVIECFGRCFHYKNTVASFMKNCDIPEILISQWKDQPKFIWAKNVINELNETEDGKILIRKIITEFYKMQNVPDEVENRDLGILALKKLKRLAENNDLVVQYTRNNNYHQSKKDEEIKKRQMKINALANLKNEYFAQFGNKDVRNRGYIFEKIISNLFKINDIHFVDSYRNKNNTQQMDGYFRFEGFDYLLEVKWENDAVNSAKIASLKQKVDTKLDATRGLFISVNGFREEVINDYSNKDAKIIFMDGVEVVYILENRI